MRIHRIDGPVSISVTLGSGGYANRLTIASTGSIDPAANGATALYAPSGLASVRVTNDGSISGGAGAYGTQAGAGGVGVDLLAAGAFMLNVGAVAGGLGGTLNAVTGGDGGAGAIFAAACVLHNSGSILGGGGASGVGFGGAGGDGVDIGVSGTVTNIGQIAGGNGGAAGEYDGGSGGKGAAFGARSNLVNAGTITGGAGAACGSGPHNDNGSNGGIGVYLGAYGAISNHGKIVGGAGGNGYGFASGCDGGIGVSLAQGGTLANSGIIVGGAAGGVEGSFGGGAAGDGVFVAPYGDVTNTGTITGGAGGAALHFGAGQPGGVGVYLNGGTLTNQGTINGGVGGVGSTRYPSGNGGAGVYLNGGTLITSGTISGGAGAIGGSANGQQGDAVQFAHAAARLVLEPGAAFDGLVAASPGVSDTLELAGRKAATLSGLGTEYTGFSTVTEDAHADWTLAASNTLGSATSLLDAGLLNVTGTLSDAAIATIDAHGVVQTSGSGALLLGGLTLAGGTLTGTSTGTIAIGTSLNGAQTGAITVQSGAAVTGFGALGGVALIDDGNITAQGGRLILQTAVSGNGTATIAAGATLEAAAGLTPSVIFAAGTSETLQLDTPTAVTGVLSGFAAGDVIDLRTIHATTMTFLGGTLTLEDGTTAVDSLTFAGDYTLSDFTLAKDGHGGTDVGFLSGAPHIAGAAYPWQAEAFLTEHHAMPILFLAHFPIANP
jgi:hypothetical protein